MITDANGATLVDPIQTEDRWIPVKDVLIGRRHRRLDEQGVESLRSSMDMVGLMHPITVRTDNTLVAGAHRLEAAKRLGWKSIPARIVQVGELIAEQMELEENLRGNPLTILERAEHIARLQEIYAERGLLKTSSRPTINANPNAITTAALAEQFGLRERSAQNYLAVARLPQEIREKTRETPVADSLKELLELAQMHDVAERDSLVAMISTGQASTIQGARKVLHPETDMEDYPLIDDPGDDTGERYDLVRAEIRLFWKQANPKMRKRIIDGEERYYRREAVPREWPFAFNIGPEAFDTASGRKFLCESLAKQLYASLGVNWPPAAAPQND